MMPIKFSFKLVNICWSHDSHLLEEKGWATVLACCIIRVSDANDSLASLTRIMQA